jgi:hypothetical protein
VNRKFEGLVMDLCLKDKVALITGSSRGHRACHRESLRGGGLPLGTFGAFE